jgi:tetratricopeptide (TPR) repeat protein
MSKLAVVLEKSANSYSLDTYAWILHLMGRDQEAKKYMSQALSLSGQQDPTYLAHYADILWALGEKFMAEVYWKKALEMGYDSEELAEHIATLKQQSSTK